MRGGTYFLLSWLASATQRDGAAQSGVDHQVAQGRRVLAQDLGTQ
jgi:hypothetical protein